MPDLLQIMKDAYANDYRGSISELMQQAIMQETQIAITPEEQQIGLSEGPPRQMIFPNTQGQDFNTVNMSYPIDMQQYDQNGELVRSYEKIPPGTGAIPGHGATTVFEQPSLYRDGGAFVPLREKLRNYKCGSTLKKK